MTQKKERGLLLTGLLIFGVIAFLASLIDPMGKRHIEKLGLTYPAWHPFSVYIKNMLGALVFVYLWSWKKIGVYLLIFNYFFAVVTGYIYLQSSKYADNLPLILTSILMSLSLAPFWYIAIKRKWHLFE